MRGIIGGQRPDITPAQLAAVAVAGVPAVSNLLAAFNAVTVNAAQQAALGDVMTWGGVVATALVVGDTGVRAARNAKDARVETTALGMPGEPVGDVPTDDDELADDDILEEPDDDVLADDDVTQALAAEALPEPREIRPSGGERA